MTETLDKVIFRNEDKKLNAQEVAKKFDETAREITDYSESEIDMLSEAYAKNPVDKFIVYKELTTEASQGDIIILPEKSYMYKELISKVENITKTDRMVLQEGDSVTGDHRVVTIPGAKCVMKTGEFTPPFMEGENPWREPKYSCVLMETDKPFLIVHREHGNISLPEGKYMFCSQIDSKSLEKMRD